MYVIGTAGHVDHGKSTLVKTLTGIDPDRWEEEQRREMTIDLGFAWLTLPSGRGVSIIDVPGHERFIKNMLAGIGGIDAALLVIAADESVMPQTAEHLAILDLLGIAHGLVVLTKADLVDQEWLDLVGEEVRTCLRGTCFAAAPQVAVSARSGQGLDTLLAALDAQLDSTQSRTQSHGEPRLPIDRAFTIGGFGAVVTGTLLDGPLHIGAEVEVVPNGLRARVRGIQTHQRNQEVALPGTRVAINLAGVSHHDLARGDMLALPGRLRPADLLDAQLRLIPAAPRPLMQNDRLDLFVGAAETPCRVTLLDREELAPGETGWVQLRLDRPIAVARGDRYIVRQPSPSRTIGGGRVVDVNPPRHRRFRPEVTAALAALARGRPTDLLLRALDDGQPHEWRELIKASGLPAGAAGEALGELLGEEKVLTLGDWRLEIGDSRDQSPISNLQSQWLISAKAWAALSEKLITALRGYQRRYPLRAGMPREELRSRLRLTGAALDAVLATGLARVHETSVCLPDHTPALTPEQQRVVRQLLDAFNAAPYSPPALDLEPELLGWLVEQNQIVRVAADIAFLPPAYATMVGWVREQIAAAGGVTVAQFRDRFGSSRRYALALLEHLDERKVTRRAGDVRVFY